MLAKYVQEIMKGNYERIIERRVQNSSSERQTFHSPFCTKLIGFHQRCTQRERKLSVLIYLQCIICLISTLCLLGLLKVVPFYVP